MTEGKPYLLWPGGDDRIVVEEMLRDSKSGQWYECREFVKKRVQVQAKNIPQDHWDDIVQDAMIRINRSLITFQHRCTLRTWLFGIVRSCIIDAHRKFTHAEQLMVPPSNPHEDVEPPQQKSRIKRRDFIEPRLRATACRAVVHRAQCRCDRARIDNCV